MKKFYPNFKSLLLSGLIILVTSFSLSAQLILTHPSNVSECEGYTTVAFTVKANTRTYTGITYKWQYLAPKTKVWYDVPSTMGQGTEITSTLSFVFDKTSGPLTTALNGYYFRCVVSGYYKILYTETSNAALLSVYSAPNVTSNPSSATKFVGESVTFSVYASSSLTKSYQWQKDYVNITGATSSSLTLTDIQISDAGGYRCRVSNSCGYDYSSSATLTVNEVEYEDGWFAQTAPTSLDIIDVDAVSRYIAWAIVNDADKLLKTSDGGDTWTAFSTASAGGTTGNWECIEMVSSTHVLIGGYYRIGVTTDGGTSWTVTNLNTALSLGTTYPYIYNIQMISSTVGYAVGANGLIIKTTDGGATWTKQNWGGDATYATDAALYDMHFISENTGWAVGYNGTIVQTTNGGSSWTLLPSYNSNTLESVYFINSSTGFATGGSKFIIKTIDGGQTWTALSTASYPYFYANILTFIDENNGYFAGQVYNYSTSSYEGCIFKTKDGGATWKQQFVENANQIYDLFMLDAEDGWAVGDAGDILRTASGGCFTPSVNLYEDKEFCASGSHTMVADTFSTNLNCDYEWNTGPTTGSLTVSTTGTYSVIVTNLCNIETSDEININVFPLPDADAGEDVTICYGDSTQLFASGGITYSWNNGSYLNYDDIQNPLASPPVGYRDFTVTVTDENTCQNTDVVRVYVNAIPTSTFTAPAFVCGSSYASLDHTGTSGIDTYYWTCEDSLSSTGITTGNPSVNWDATNLGVKEISLVVEKDGCFSDTTYSDLEVRVVPTADFDAPARICGDDPVVLDYTGTAPEGASYTWSTTGGTATGSGQGPVEVVYATEGTKTVGLEVVQNECSSGLNEKDILVVYPFEGEKICIVTIDLETGKNMVVWEKTPDVGIASYNVYRLGTGGIYNLIGNVSVDSLSVYVDEDSEPEKTQYLYKISAVDTCGNESAKSHYHKTLFLQYTSSDGGVNLLWQDYQIEDETVDFSDFNIYRGSDSTALAQIDIVSGSNVYTDVDVAATTQRMYYRVAGVLPEACDPAGLLDKKAGSGPFVHSLSNLEDNRLQTGINDGLASLYKLQIFPNPFSDRTSVIYSLPTDTHVKVELYNILGKQISVLYNATQFAGEQKIEIDASDLNYMKGLYYVRIHFEDQYLTKKIILE